jgi:3'-phosphoadenosine 5'-phosphosulfate sulfotransferase (PAPS reductase)/FAD synthetase
MEQEIVSKMEAAIGVMQRYIELGHSLSCAYSGGKDSTCTLVLMLEAIRRAGGTTITHHVQSADTTIETRISFPRGDLPGKYHRKWTLLVGT